MKLLADENFPWKAVKALRLQGHDVAWVAEDKPGSEDREVLAQAIKEQRVILTFDRDFSHLAFQMRIHANTGVILFAIPLNFPEQIVEIAVRALKSRNDWAGHFSIVEENYIRMIPLTK